MGAGRKACPAKALRKQVPKVKGGDPAAINAQILAHGPKCVTNLIKLADGGYERVTRTLQPAGMVMVKRPMMRPVEKIDGQDEQGFNRYVPVVGDDGNPVMTPCLDEQGRPIYIEVLLYPDLPPSKLVEVSRSVQVADCDRASNQYLIDRVAGKPRQAVELKSQGPGVAVQVQVYLPDNGRDPRPGGSTAVAQAQLDSPRDISLDIG